MFLYDVRQRKKKGLSWFSKQLIQNKTYKTVTIQKTKREEEGEREAFRIFLHEPSPS
jgi:hypothetical protein